jgi:hypothetical protein
MWPPSAFALTACGSLLQAEAEGEGEGDPTPSGKARCSGRSAKGEQCKRSASEGEVLCWHHLQHLRSEVTSAAEEEEEEEVQAEAGEVKDAERGGGASRRKGTPTRYG